MKKEGSNREYWWVDESDCGGYYQHGDSIESVYLTLKEFREVEKTGRYNGVKGKIFKDILAASCYVSD